MIISYRRILPLLVVLTAFASILNVQAQIGVKLKMSKSQYVTHERVLATVTVTNHAGRDLLIHSEGAGRGAISWLDFAVTTSRGEALSPFSRVSFPAVRIPAGRSISKTLDLTGIYAVADLGNYRVHAVVRMPDKGGIFNSNTASFGVTKGTTIYTQRVGDPASRNLREYRVSIFNAGEKSSIYVHVVDVRSGRTLQAVQLGEALTFKKPRATVDRKSNLHILYLSAPGIYGHAQVTPDGKSLGTNLFKRAPGQQPSLATFANGEVVVAGGISFDPKAAREQRAQIRGLSERPRLTFR